MGRNNCIAWCQTLYEQKASDLLLYGRALGLSHSEAEDVLQDTFMALLQRAEKPDSPEHYCVRSFRNRALNYRRSLWRRLVRELESQKWFETASIQTDAEKAALDCLQRLPQEQREALVLRVWHQYTFEEIGALLDIPANTAAGRYRYGLEKLRRGMKGIAYEGNERFGEALGYLATTPPVREG